MTLPCEFCDRLPGDCPCIVDPIAVRRARRDINARHRAAVERARVSARLDRSKGAA